MDPARHAFLFGAVALDFDVDDPEERVAFLRERFPAPDRESGSANLAAQVTGIVASQIADDDPPEVWATARRLLAAGLDPVRVMAQLRMAMLAHIHGVLSSGVPADPAAYREALARLPLPSAAEVEDAMLAVLAEDQPIDIDALEERAAARLGRDLSDDLVRALVDRVSDELVAADGPLALLAGDRVVAPARLCTDVVLTHRLEASEVDLGVLNLGVDLAGFRRMAPRAPGSAQRVELVVGHDESTGVWIGPEGWLGAFSAGDLVAVRIVDDEVCLEDLADQPPVDHRLVARLRSVYDREVAEPDLPVVVEDLVLGVLADDSAGFSVPQAPVSELVAAAGLELREGYTAHEPRLWANATTVARIQRIMDQVGERGDVVDVLEFLECSAEAEPDPGRLAGCARVIADIELCSLVAEEIIGDEDDPDGARRAVAFGELVARTAGRRDIEAGGRWLAAIGCERCGEVELAEAHLHLAAEADPGWEPAQDRLAWYLSDRGRAAEAARIWRRLGATAADSPDLAMVETFARTGRSKLGRNEACWCGSGRKYKQCHLGAVETAPLPERVGWICRKAAGYLERRGGDAAMDVFHLAAVRAGGTDPDGLRRALSDAVVVDLALTEGGWFERFLEDRGRLLPDDEALLAASWVMVDRTLYEVAGVDPGVGLVLVDLRSAERLEVSERTFSLEATVGTVICARAVPDGGDGHQLVGAVLPVAAGREAELLEVLDEADPEALAAWTAMLDARPLMATREGEPLVVCEAGILVADPAAARAALDAAYERDGDDCWVEMHALGASADDDRILRATIELTGDRLAVATSSEVRMDRVLAWVRSALPGAVVVSDERRALGPGEMPPPPPRWSVGGTPLEVTAEIADQIRDRLEDRWCEESVPALGGLTPRQAAGDPTRRELLERLLVEIGELSRGVPAGGIAMRPERLRRLLGL